MKNSIAYTPSEEQSSNNALAVLAASGDRAALGKLWENNKGLLHLLFFRWYTQYSDTANAHGLTLEDLEQEGFFAVLYAAEHYDSTKGKFSTILTWAVRKTITELLREDHGQQVVTRDGRSLRISANPLNHCSSLDLPLSYEDPDGGTLSDLVPDPLASAEFEMVENAIYNHQLHNALEEAMSKLTEQEADIIRLRYYEGQTQRGASEACNIPIDDIRRAERRAIRKLAYNPHLREWESRIIQTRAWRETGWKAWNSGGSVEERIVEYLDSKGAYLYQPIPAAAQA